MGIAGAALGATLVSVALRRLGRRPGLVVGYGVGAAGALIAGFALRLGSFPLLLLGAALFGIGNASNQLTRYVVADMHDAEHRGRALGWIVWAGTIGGVIGPSLLAPAGRVAEAAGLPELAGPYGVAALVMAVVAVGYQLVLCPDPATLAVIEEEDDRRGRLRGRGAVAVATADRPDGDRGHGHRPGRDGVADVDDTGPHPGGRG